ncbi:MAG: L-seryl-tRNA(Sec) selenium transferase [Pyrinomonadaceae bacterium]
MENHHPTKTSSALRNLPPMEAVLQTVAALKILPETGAGHLTDLARRAMETLRRELLEEFSKDEGGAENYSREFLLERAERRLMTVWQEEKSRALQRVINATGVIVHTNLGRAPLSENARKAILERAARYCSLEYDIETGERGKRGGGAERLLTELTGAEAALIVNNCASAAVLVLTALAKGGEAIISRGELVEIGGDFRVPDVMAESGVRLKEVGTTNRTKPVDYQKAITPETRMLVKVHPSNYRIVGFTSVPGVRELSEMAHQNDILFYEDAGSGALVDLGRWGLSDEPVIARSIADGADVVTFSGDKLLGATQAGLIVGRRPVIETLRKHPLYRALRANKLIYAALEATLEAFRRKTHLEEIPVLKMLSATKAEMAQRTRAFAERLREKLGENSGLRFEVIEGNSVIGGGSAPLVQPDTALLSIWHDRLSVNRLEKELRLSQPPVAARILDEMVVIDLRTVAESEEAELLEVLPKVGGR